MYDKIALKEGVQMGRVNYTIEQIIVKLREVELFAARAKLSERLSVKLECLSRPFTDGGRSMVG